MTEVAKIEPKDHAPAQHTGGDHLVSMIERVAMNPDLPIERLEKMLDMKERMEDRARQDEERHQRKAYFTAMAKCQSELPIIQKTQENTHTRSRYADLAAIERQAMPIIHGYGFSVSFQPKGADADGNLLVQWTVGHADGHTESDTAAFPLDVAGAQGKSNKTAIQAMGSTATYARRYLLCMLFNISTGDDQDGNAPPVGGPITAEQFAELRDLIEKAGIDQNVVERAERVANLEELPASRFGQVKAKLMQTGARK